MDHTLSMAWDRAFRDAFRDWPMAVSRRPVFREGSESLPILVVCPPWRYEPSLFLEDVASHMRTRPSGHIVVLAHPFEHKEGGGEWWSYAPVGGGDLMSELGLAARNMTQVSASINCVCKFLAEMQSVCSSELLLLGSSQGGSLAAHAGMMCSDTHSLSRVFCLQPAGFYMPLWQGSSDVIVDHELKRGFSHGDLGQWGGRTCRKRRKRCILFSFSTDDDVAPVSLLRLLP